MSLFRTLVESILKECLLDEADQELWDFAKGVDGRLSKLTNYKKTSDFQEWPNSIYWDTDIVCDYNWDRQGPFKNLPIHINIPVKIRCSNHSKTPKNAIDIQVTIPNRDRFKSSKYIYPHNKDEREKYILSKSNIEEYKEQAWNDYIDYFKEQWFGDDRDHRNFGLKYCFDSINNEMFILDYYKADFDINKIPKGRHRYLNRLNSITRYTRDGHSIFIPTNWLNNFLEKNKDQIKRIAENMMSMNY